MLLIAQPKSASTSLAVTIGNTTGRDVMLGVPRKSDSINCEGFQQIQKYHNNMVARSQKFLDQVVQGTNTIFKEHLLPTDDHITKLNKYKKEKIVILLREPEDSIDAYARLFEKNNKVKTKEEQEQLADDIFSFHERWQYWKSVHKNVKIIYYRDLVLHYTATMNTILKHYGFKMPIKLLPLQKLKYTGTGVKRLCS